LGTLLPEVVRWHSFLLKVLSSFNYLTTTWGDVMLMMIKLVIVSIVGLLLMILVGGIAYEGMKVLMRRFHG